MQSQHKLVQPIAATGHDDETVVNAATEPKCVSIKIQLDYA
jgi:hypothetical protein